MLGIYFKYGYLWCAHEQYYSSCNFVQVRKEINVTHSLAIELPSKRWDWQRHLQIVMRGISLETLNANCRNKTRR